LEKLESIQSSPTTIKDFYELLLPIIKFWSDFDETQQNGQKVGEGEVI
jgi:hypothetical protein